QIPNIDSELYEKENWERLRKEFEQAKSDSLQYNDNDQDGIKKLREAIANTYSLFMQRKAQFENNLDISSKIDVSDDKIDQIPTKRLIEDCLNLVLSKKIDLVKIDSKIIAKYEDLKLLKSWIPSNESNIKFKLLYRASADGWKVKDFHTKC